MTYWILRTILLLVKQYWHNKIFYLLIKEERKYYSSTGTEGVNASVRKLQQRGIKNVGGRLKHTAGCFEVSHDSVQLCPHLVPQLCPGWNIKDILKKKKKVILLNPSDSVNISCRLKRFLNMGVLYIKWWLESALGLRLLLLSAQYYTSVVLLLECCVEMMEMNRSCVHSEQTHKHRRYIRTTHHRLRRSPDIGQLYRKGK